MFHVHGLEEPRHGSWGAAWRQRGRRWRRQPRRRDLGGTDIARSVLDGERTEFHADWTERQIGRLADGPNAWKCAQRRIFGDVRPSAEIIQLLAPPCGAAR